jgi:hypothetical protein
MNYTDFDYTDLLMIIFMLLVCILSYLQAYMLIRVILLILLSLEAIDIIGLTTYNILLLIPLAIMYVTWNELKEEDTESKTTKIIRKKMNKIMKIMYATWNALHEYDSNNKENKTIRKKINTIMKRIFWIMTIVQTIIIVYIYVRHDVYHYMSEVIWDYGITIEQTFTVEEKIKYLEEYLQISKEYLENDEDKVKAYEDSMIEKTVAEAQTKYPYENDIRERMINALGNIRMHIILDDMRESMLKGISNVRIMDVKEYISEIINKEFLERLNKASEKLDEEMKELYKERRNPLAEDIIKFIKDYLGL